MEEEFKRAGRTADVSDEDFQEFAKDERFIHLAGCVAPRRPGILLFAVRLEYSNFPPGTAKNDQYILHLIDWQEIRWSIISIPKESMEIARKMAQEAGLRIADGIPTMIIGGHSELFPMKTNNVFTLENSKGHEVYKNNLKAIAELIEKEDAEILEIQRKHEIARHN